MLSTTTRRGHIPAEYSAFVRRRGEQYLDSSAFKMSAFARQAHPLITAEYASQFWRVDRPCGFHSCCILLRGGRLRSLFTPAGGATSQVHLRGCSASAVVQHRHAQGVTVASGHGAEGDTGRASPLSLVDIYENTYSAHLPVRTVKHAYSAL